MGTFIGRDPVGYWSGDANLYRYLSGNPSNWVDPSGLEGWVPDYVQGYEGWIPDYLQGREGWVPDFLWGESDRGELSPYGAFVGGTATGGKAIVNQGARAGYSTLTLGLDECGDLLPVTEEDRFLGYDYSATAARLGSELLIGVSPAYLVKLGRAGTLAGRGINIYDSAGNLVSVGSGAVNAANNGLNWGNGLQMAGGAVGLTGNGFAAWSLYRNKKSFIDLITPEEAARYRAYWTGMHDDSGSYPFAIKKTYT